MKRMILILAPVIGMMMCLSCSNKMAMSQAPAKTTAINEAEYIPFSKSLKQRLEHDHADIKKIQFYVDQSLVLRRTSGLEKGVVKSGNISYDNGQTVTEITIPAYTPGVCEKIEGDSLLISFDAPGNTFVFGALYANENFMMLGTNWYNGVTDVTYDNKIYKVHCAKCGNAGDARLVIKKGQVGGSSVPKTVSSAKVLAGRKLK